VCDQCIPEAIKPRLLLGVPGEMDLVLPCGFTLGRSDDPFLDLI
jgi:hypothetical protein